MEVFMKSLNSTFGITRIVLPIITWLSGALLVVGQVGVNTLQPDPSAALEVFSQNRGLLIPRLALHSDLSQAGVVDNPATGLMVYNNGPNHEHGFYQWNGQRWLFAANDDQIATYSAYRRVHMGYLPINSSGTLSVSDIPFEPDVVRFIAYANVESDNIDAAGANTNNQENYAGGCMGFALNIEGTPMQQTIHSGGSGRSINTVSRYSSNQHCIGIRYANQNGTLFGLTTARLLNFTSNGFVLNVDHCYDPLYVLYIAFGGVTKPSARMSVSAGRNTLVPGVTDINFGEALKLNADGSGGCLIEEEFAAENSVAVLDVALANNYSYKSSQLKTIQWTQNNIVDEVFEHSTSVNAERIKVLENGLYELSYKFVVQLDKYKQQFWIRLFQNENELLGYGADLNVGSNELVNTTHAVQLIRLNAGDYLSCKVQSSENKEVVIFGDETHLTLKKIRD